MKKCMLGNQKHGCLIDNEKGELVYYDLLSLAEKMQGKPHEIIMPYEQIDNIQVCSSVVKGVRFGTTTMTLEVHFKNQTSRDVVIVYFDTTKEELRNFINVLQNSSLFIKDPQQILNAIMTQEGTIGDILDHLTK